MINRVIAIEMIENEKNRKILKLYFILFLCMNVLLLRYYCIIITQIYYLFTDV